MEGQNAFGPNEHTQKYPDRNECSNSEVIEASVFGASGTGDQEEGPRSGDLC